MKIAAFTVMLPDLAPEEAATVLNDAGYDGIEWRVTRVPEERRVEPPSFWGNNLCTLEPTAAEARRARELAESAGLEIPSLGTYIAVGDLPAVEEAMCFAQIAGAPQIRVGVGSLAGGSYSERFVAATEFLTAVEALARRHGIKALVETHHGTICPSASSAYRLVSQFDPQYMGVLYDPGNLAHEGFEDYRLGIELLGPYLAHVHVKNCAYDRPAVAGLWTPRWAPLEDGVVNFADLFAALRAGGYNGWLSVEDFSQVRSSREVLRHNLRFIRQALVRQTSPATGSTLLSQKTISREEFGAVPPASLGSCPPPARETTTPQREDGHGQSEGKCAEARRHRRGGGGIQHAPAGPAIRERRLGRGIRRRCGSGPGSRAGARVRLLHRPSQDVGRDKS